MLITPCDGPVGPSLVLTAAALRLYSLTTTVVVYRKVSLGRALNCVIVGPRWLATALVVCLQAGIAMMLFVGHLELRHRAATARPLNGDLPFASSAKGPKAV